MKNFKTNEAVVNSLLQAYNKNEIIILLQKVQNDFLMLDEKIKELLNTDIIDIEGLEVVDLNFDQSYNELNELAELRNKKIEELLKTVKKQTL
jgi:hypothetical protein